MGAAEELLLDSEPIEATASECVAFVSDNQTHGVVESVARQFFDSPVVREGDTHQALEYLADFPTPKVLIVDIGETSAPLTAMLSLTAAFTEDTRLIGIGTINDINLYREMVGAGITDYLIKPVTEKALAAALTRAEEPTQKAAAPEDQSATSKLNRIAIVGARGGVGASTIAVSLAWLMSEDRKQKTALVDLDLEFGTVALSLDLEPTRGLREALESPGRIDSLFVESATAKLTERLSIMATEETLAADLHFNPDAVDLLFDALGRINDVIIVDLPRSAFAVRQCVFEATSMIVLVTDLSLSSLRDSMRIINGIHELGPDKEVFVVANRTNGPHQSMQPGDFQKALGHKINVLIPEDPKAFHHAANAGKPVVQSQPRSKASKAIQGLAAKLGNETAAKKDKKDKKKDKTSGKLLGRFFKKG